MCVEHQTNKENRCKCYEWKPIKCVCNSNRVRCDRYTTHTSECIPSRVDKHIDFSAAENPVTTHNTWRCTNTTTAQQKNAYTSTSQPHSIRSTVRVWTVSCRSSVLRSSVQDVRATWTYIGMYGQRQILSCLAIVAFVTILNFYRSAIRRDKEQRHYAAVNRRERQLQETLERHARFKSHWLEYEDRCWDVHALVFRPESPERIELQDKNRRQDDHRQQIEKPIESSSLCGFAAQQSSNSIRSKPTTTTSSLAKPTTTTTLPGATTTAPTAPATESTAGVVYVAVFILLVSLGKAAYDLSKQFKEVCSLRCKFDAICCG